MAEYTDGTYNVDIVRELVGKIEDEQGFMQPTYNWLVGCGHVTGYFEMDKDDFANEKDYEKYLSNHELLPIGTFVCYARNGADVLELEKCEETDDALDDYLKCWDDDYLEDFRRENII